MQIRNPELWALLVDTQPPARVRVVEGWADAMEAWIDTTRHPTPSVGQVVGALVATLQHIQADAATEAELLLAFRILLGTWQHAAGVAAILEVVELETMVTP